MATKIVLLLAQSARSVAYVQALSNANVEVNNVIAYGNTSFSLNTKRRIDIKSADLFCPDLTLSLEQSLAVTDWPVWHCNEKALDNQMLLAKLAELNPELIVFSGYGGQIVPKVLLDIAPILHIHSGLLPDFPGSTTIYYQMLAQECCGASAMLLDETIDTGPVLATKTYAMPAKQEDIDYYYDTMIRADLLVEVVANIDKYEINDTSRKATYQATPYFIIHPLLKHIAILSADNHSEQQGQQID